MDHDMQPSLNPKLGLCGADAEIFQRVWNRVMPEPRPDCPITIGPIPMPLVTEDTPLPDMRPEQPSPAQPPASCVVEYPMSGKLRAFVAAELADRRYYRALSARVRGMGAKTLAAIAAEEERHARRLSAAYFLLTGVRYWPEGETPPTLTTYLGALRDRYWGERQGAETYRAVADQCADPVLRELFLDLAEDEGSHAHLLRSLLEQM